VEMRGQGIRNKDGKVTYVVFASRDITQVRKTEQALHEERRKLLLIAETIDEAFWIRDPVSRQLVYATDKWRSLFGIDPDSPRLHEQLLARVHADDIPKVTELLETESIKTPFNIEYRIVMADGSVRWIRSKGGPAKKSDDHQCLVVGASSDITARKVIEEQLLKTQKLEALAHMARQMAHDFNNLLAIILGNLDEAEASLPNNENITAAQSATLRGAEITKKLLALARQNTGLPVN